jgi:ferrous iron transport protein A
MMTGVCPTRVMDLASLRPGQAGTVCAVHAEDGFRQRLAAMGFRVGKSIVLVRAAPLGGPLHVRLGTTDVALRRSEAAHIDILVRSDAAPASDSGAP